MEYKNIMLSVKDIADLDKVKKEINARTKPETIRFLIREYHKSKSKK